MIIIIVIIIIIIIITIPAKNSNDNNNDYYINDNDNNNNNSNICICNTFSMDSKTIHHVKLYVLLLKVATYLNCSFLKFYKTVNSKAQLILGFTVSSLTPWPVKTP